MVKYRDTGNNRTAQTSWLAFANFISLISALIISAVLSRFMTPAEYGTYCQVNYVYSTLLVLFSFGLPGAYSYFLARVPVEEGRDVVRKLNLLFFGLSSFFSIVLFFGSGTIAELLGNALLADNLKYFAVTPMLLMPVIGVVKILTVYGRSYLIVAYVVISRMFVIACTVLPVVVFNAGATGAVVGLVASSLVSCAVGLRLAFVPFRNVTSVKTSLTAGKIFRFSTPVFISGIYGFVFGSASQFFVSRYFGVEDFALFANGYRELPMAGMIIGAMAGVLLPEFSRMSKNGADSGQYVALWKNVIFKSSSIIYPLSVFCCVFAPEIMSLLYGDGYRQAAWLFRIVTIINLTRIAPYSPIMFALGQGRKFANTHLATAVLIVGLDLLCVNFFPSLTAVAVIAVLSTLLCFVVLMITISRMLKTTVAGLMPWGVMLRILFASVTACLVAKLAVSMAGMTHDFAALSFGFAIYLLLYGFASVMAGIDYAGVLGPVISGTKAGDLVKSIFMRVRYIRNNR